MAVQTQIQVRRGTASSWTSTNPTLAAGELGFETDTSKFKIGTGSGTWTSLAYAGGGQNTLTTYQYTATSGQTTFSGVDSNGNTLSYTVGNIQVYLNGVLLVNTAEYTATSGTSIVLGTGAVTGDSLTVTSLGAFTVSSDIPKSTLTAKGSIVTATAGSTPANLSVGANGTVLTADSAEASGLKWAAAAAAGKPIIQMVTASTTTSVTIASTSFTDSGLSGSITPTLSTSKILVMIMQPSYSYRDGNAYVVESQILRGATQVAFNTRFMRPWASSSAHMEMGYNATFIYLDSPATTSALTYKTQYKFDTTAGSAELIMQYNSAESQIILMEIGA
jgi:hypothetical protein